MLRAVREFLQSIVDPAGDTPPDAHTLELAAAVLMVEVMRADPQLHEAERLAAAAALRHHFGMAPDEGARLLELAQEVSRSANDFHSFTARINARFTHEQKIRVVESMWRVAYADGHLDAHERHLIARVAGLLHVTHGEHIAAKLHAKQASGLPPA